MQSLQLLTKGIELDLPFWDFFDIDMQIHVKFSISFPIEIVILLITGFMNHHIYKESPWLF